MRLTAPNPLKALRSAASEAAAKVDRLRAAAEAEQANLDRAELARTAAVARIAATGDDAGRVELATAGSRAEAARANLASLEAALREAEAARDVANAELANAEAVEQTAADEKVAESLRREADDLLAEAVRHFHGFAIALEVRAGVARKVAELAPRAVPIAILPIPELVERLDPESTEGGVPLRYRDTALYSNYVDAVNGLVAVKGGSLGRSGHIFAATLDRLGLRK